ncbi:MAG: type I DNA topoisomerase [Flavobacteriales bacterium]|jgi:DNA topoisomerase-1|nr:type I DNA topoisomerase [Flavobacteriales bacterium]
MAQNLVIVESPAKAKTIEGYLGKDFIVKSSFGHVRDLAKKGEAIDIENNFAPNYEVSDDKKKVVAELRKLSKAAEIVWLATDEDREGEAISWHLQETLKLKEEKVKRITFNEITKQAVQKAIATPRTIDIDLVNAQQARRILDRIVGFELSPVLWKKVRPSLSAGRVQSVTVRIIAEREREIESFDSTSSYKVVGDFVVNGKVFKAEISKNFKTEKEAEAFIHKCADATFTINNLEKKPAVRKPAPPFTTSTLQQEASRKLGYNVARTMNLAQRLYEAGLITYMRTDSLNLSDFAVKNAAEEVVSAYGKAYSKTRKFKTNKAGAQEAHEAIRPTNFAVHSAGADAQQQRLYQLIWKRTIASQMAEAELEKTKITIDVSGASEQFVANGEVIKFDGFLKVYLEGTDDENDDEQKGMLPAVKIGEALTSKIITATERFTRPPARYTEASLVKKLEELGIGRPSTYAPTISTIQKRGYVERKEKEGKERNYTQFVLESGTVDRKVKKEVYGADRNKLMPTDIGFVVNDFLIEHFGKVLDYNFTANVEKEFDDIAQGLMEWTQMLEKFYSPFHKNIEHTLEHSDRASGERILGTHPESGKQVSVRIGKFGPMAQIGSQDDEEKQYASLQANQSLSSITLAEALDLFLLPKDLGKYEGEGVIVSNGRFGPYVKYGKAYVSLPKGENPLDVDFNRAVELIVAKQKADAPVDEYEGLPVQKGKGRFGPFIKWNGMFINVNKKYDFDNLSHDDIVELIETKKKKEIEKVIHNWESEGIRVEKARWGRFNIIKGKTKIEMPKTTDAAKLTLEQVKAIIEENAPKKKTRKTTAKKKK